MPWVSSPNAEFPIQVAEGDVKPRTVIEVFQHRVAETPNTKALSVERDGEWKTWTYQQYYDECKAAARAMIKLGLERFHAVCIIGFNSPEWFIADIGAIFAGGFAAGIYTTNSAEACHFVANDCEANVIFVENEAQLKKILQVRSQLPQLKAIVQYIGKPSVQDPTIYSWEDFLKIGQDKETDTILEARMADQKPGHCCTLIYTSGTTGNPKGVMLSHDNMTWTTSRFEVVLTKGKEEHFVSYLPLSHVAAQMVDIHLPMLLGGTTWFARPDALKGSLVDTLRVARPTFFVGVPRVWEKISEKMKEAGRSAGAVGSYISSWVKYIGYNGNVAMIKGEPHNVPWGWWLAKNYVLPKIRVSLGLDRCRMAITAAAPISAETSDYFLSVDVPLFEIYGMSECSGPQTISIPGKQKLYSCGFVLPGAGIKTDSKDGKSDGEILFYGRHVMMGYLNQPGKTAETFTEDGWLRSGDIGRLDEDGFCFITGRLKELIITAGGENVPPVIIEDEVKESLPIVGNCMLVGDKKKFLTILLSLKCVHDSEGHPTDKLDRSVIQILQSIGSSATTISEARKDELVHKHIQKGIEMRNKKATSNAQKIQKFFIIPEEFSVNGGELGPTLKLRRQIVAKKYEVEIEKMYDVDD